MISIIGSPAFAVEYGSPASSVGFLPLVAVHYKLQQRHDEGMC
jgi:hypothetical protein